MAMNQEKIDDLIVKFTQAAKNHYEASLNGDWRTANKEAATIRKTVMKLRSLDACGKEALLAQADNQDPSVASMAAVYSLKYATKKSISVLARVAKEPGLLGFEAEQALQRWNEGEWHLE